MCTVATLRGYGNVYGVQSSAMSKHMQLQPMNETTGRVRGQTLVTCGCTAYVTSGSMSIVSKSRKKDYVVSMFCLVSV